MLQLWVVPAKGTCYLEHATLLKPAKGDTSTTLASPRYTSTPSALYAAILSCACKGYHWYLEHATSLRPAKGTTQYLEHATLAHKRVPLSTSREPLQACKGHYLVPGTRPNLAETKRPRVLLFHSLVNLGLQRVPLSTWNTPTKDAPCQQRVPQGIRNPLRDRTEYQGTPVLP